MPIDLAGISNENEFYTEHYLAAILDGDLRDTLSQWRREAQEEGTQAPFEVLRGLTGEFFRVHAAISRARAAEERLALQRGLLCRVLTALGYRPDAGWQPLEGGTLLPVLATLQRPNGAPELWAIEVLGSEQSDPLDSPLQPCQFPTGDPAPRDLLAENLDEIVTTRVFALSEPPRWLILASFGNLVLIDRSKWNEKRLLRFDLREIFDRKQTSTLEAMTALLHAESVQPLQAGAASLLDELDANSHRHAFSVSEDLKFALREAIELLGNEAVYDMRTRRKEAIYDRGLAEQLSRECLRYMYRLLFLFYIEARPELGYAPMKAEAYRRGCSLEWLRDLELVDLDTPEAQDGYFLHYSIEKSFNLVWDGYPAERQRALDATLDVGFEIAPLKSHLFDPARTPLLSGLRFRNRVLRRIIELMSLSKERQGRRDRRGRVSYAQLGINQLGAVYEALLSFRGFFAEEDLFEVKRADSEWKELEPAFFVTEAELPLYTDAEKYFGGKLRPFSRGTFIYRLSGRDREKSASYYTPESLTRCLVKYALKELLKDKTADEILQLTICEPAMGSAAFLNEAVSQLADAYLDRKQHETGRRIAHEDYARERQKVKMRLADRNVFGVDLNPVALELAEVSLWLNCMFCAETEGGGAFIPWFGLQLVCGNSLIGARRDVWAPEFLTKHRGQPIWHQVPPSRVEPQARRAQGQVWHFLLPDPGMGDWNGRAVRDLVAPHLARVREWRRHFVSPAFEPQHVRALQRLSAAIDRLWAANASQLREMRARTTDTLDVWGERPSASAVRTPAQIKDRIREAELLTRSLRASSPYRRLKLVMDYWCALWFWPIERSELLPTRDEWLLELSVILEGQIATVPPERAVAPWLFPEMSGPEQLKFELERLGIVDIDALCQRLPRLTLVDELAVRHRFLHWELEFADLFEDRGGFDLTLGNPPWIKVEFDEAGTLGEADPMLAIRNTSATEATRRRTVVLARSGALDGYLAEYENAVGIQAFLNALQNYPQLGGVQTNLFKCFLPVMWRNSRDGGISALLHPEGVYDDPRGGALRRAMYQRLAAHYQFTNEKKLFAEPDHHTAFSVNVYRTTNRSATIEFDTIANLFLPSTVDACFEHSGDGLVPGIKSAAGDWETHGHRNRLVRVDEHILAVFAELYDDKETPPVQARLPAVHSSEIADVLVKLAAAPRRLADLAADTFFTECWHETMQQRDGTMLRQTRFADAADTTILSGPHFFVGNPFYKTPRAVCSLNSDYDVIDLEGLPDVYLPRFNYVPACASAEYLARAPKPPWSSEAVTSRYKVVFRRRLSASLERTLISAIAFPGAAHIHTVTSVSTSTSETLTDVAALTSSIPVDFYLRTTGRDDLYWETLGKFPYVSSTELRVRTLLLNCLTRAYAELWQECFSPSFRNDCWTKRDPRLDPAQFNRLGPNWTWKTPVRSDFARRQALVEIDALVAMALDLALDELKAIWRVQFPIARQYEAETFYDAKGRIVFTTSRGLVRVGLRREEWERVKDLPAGEIVSRTIIDDTQPGGPCERTITYVAPFDRCDREADYDLAWAAFEHSRGSAGAEAAK